jgi:uncharacterized membrane protein
MVELLIVVVVLLVFVLILMGIDSDSSKEDTFRAWKRLERIYHPDTSKDDGDEEKMKEINMAKDRIFRIRRWD